MSECVVSIRQVPRIRRVMQRQGEVTLGMDVERCTIKMSPFAWGGVVEKRAVEGVPGFVGCEIAGLQVERSLATSRRWKDCVGIIFFDAGDTPNVKEKGMYRTEPRIYTEESVLFVDRSAFVRDSVWAMSVIERAQVECGSWLSSWIADTRRELDERSAIRGDLS